MWLKILGEPFVDGYSGNIIHNERLGTYESFRLSYSYSSGSYTFGFVIYAKNGFTPYINTGVTHINEWVHYCIVWTKSNLKFKNYDNGIAGYTCATQTIAARSDTDHVIMVGDASYSGPFLIDDLCVWEEALSDGDIMALYESYNSC